MLDNYTLTVLVGILGFLLLLSRLSAHWEQRQTIKDLKEDRDRLKSELEGEKRKGEDLMARLFEANNLAAILIAEGGSEDTFERSRIVHNVKARIQGHSNPIMLISDGHLGKALDVMLSITTGEDFQDTVAMKGRLKQLGKQVQKGVIDNEEFQRFVNEIRQAALGICVNYYPNPPPQG